MKKITVYNRKTGNKVEFLTRREVLYGLMSPSSSHYSFYSPLLDSVIERYKNVPLTRHQITESEKDRLAESPELIHDIPYWEVKGYDRAVSGDRFDQKLRDEFCELFENGSPIIVDFINDNNPNFYAVLKEV